jgi:hypothetical protein
MTMADIAPRMRVDGFEPGHRPGENNQRVAKPIGLGRYPMAGRASRMDSLASQRAKRHWVQP